MKRRKYATMDEHIDWNRSWFPLLIWLLISSIAFISSINLINITNTLIEEHKIFYLLGCIYFIVQVARIIGYPEFYTTTREEIKYIR